MIQRYTIEIRTEESLIDLSTVIEKVLTEKIKVQTNDGEGDGLVDINCSLEEEE